MSLDNAYMTVGSASDVTNVNPYTSSLWNQSSSDYNEALAMLSSLGNQMSSLYKQAQNMDISSTGGFSNFMGQVPALQQLAESATTPYSTAAGTYADLAAANAAKAVEGEYASSGNLYTGGFAKAAAEAMAEPYYEAAANTESLQANLLNSLYSTGLTTAQSGYSDALSAQLSALGLQSDLLGTQYSATSNQASTLASLLGSLGQSEYWQPTYVENPSSFANWGPELLGGLLGAAIGGGTGTGLGAGAANSSLLGNWSEWTFNWPWS